MTSSLNYTSDDFLAVFNDNWTQLLTDSLEMYRQSTSEISHEMVQYDPLPVNCIIRGLVYGYEASFQYSVKHIRTTNIHPHTYSFQTQPYPQYSYLFRKLPTTPTVPSTPQLSIGNFREFIREGRPDGLYNWVLCMYQGTIGIYYKQLYPLLPCANTINTMIVAIANGEVAGLRILPEDTTISILIGGQFITATNSDGHKMFNVNITTKNSFAKFNDIIDSPHLEDFLKISFRCLGPTYTNTLTFNVDLTAESFLHLLPPFSLEQNRNMIRTFATLYGYAAYEFNHHNQVERRAYARSTCLAVAKYAAKRRLHETSLSRISAFTEEASAFYAGTSNHEDIKLLNSQYVTAQNLFTAEHSATRPLNTNELAIYRIV